MATANHFIADAFLGALTAAVAAYAAALAGPRAPGGVDVLAACQARIASPPDGPPRPPAERRALVRDALIESRLTPTRSR